MADEGSTEREREVAIVAAYLAGKKITDIEHTYGVGRSTIFHYLRRADKVPNRSRRQLEGPSKDAALAGLYELIGHQDKRIAEADDTIAGLRKELAARDRKIARLSRSLATHNGAASKEVRAV